MPELTRCDEFVGPPRDVARQLFALPMSVVEARCYALALESSGRADVRVFVRANPGDELGDVHDWTGTHLGDLPERLVQACWDRTASDGRAALTEALDGLGPTARRTGIACPPTPRGAFGHQLRLHEGAGEVHAVVVS